MTEYCPHLWQTITIDHKGDVYSCCLIQPAKMGSIYTDKLSDLINVPEIVKLRQESLQGKLPCYSGCNLIEKTPIDADNLKNYSPLCNYTDFQTIYLDFGLKCNISCIMCRQRERYKTDKSGLNADILISNIDIQPFKNIFLQGGEPLYIDECLKYMDHLAEKGKKYSLLTNGLLINDKMAGKLAKEANLVSVSLNAATKKTHETVNRGSSWELVLKNIQYLKDSRNELDSDLSINGRMTLTVNSLNEIPLFLKSYKEFGFDTINFGYDRDTVPSFLRENPKFTAKLSEDIKSVMCTADHSTIDSLRLSQLNLL